MMQTLRMHSVTPSYHHSLSLTSNNSTLDSPTTASEYTVAHSFFSETPLTALSASTRRQLSQLLNSKKVLRSEEGYERDWRGIAALSKQKFLCDENAISGDDPIAKVLTLWCANNPQSATFANLENYLGIIDRWDVSDDITENLVRDSEVYKSKQQLQSYTSASDDTDNSSQFNGNGNTYQTDFAHGSDPNILTEDDVVRAQKGLPPQQYDAFVLFADEDINYAVELITRLEEESAYNFKLCLKERDCLGGISFPHVKLSQLIEDRCKHLIVILTQEFLKSPENTFLVDYTQSNQIKYNTRKIIPLIYDSTVAIPKTLQIYTHLKYSSQTTGLVNFWAKLASSIRNVNHHHIEPAPTTAHYATHKERYSSSSKQLSIASANSNSSANTQQLSLDLSQLPTPPTEIPSININGHAFTPEDEHDGVAVAVEDSDETKTKTGKNERRLFKKRSSLRQSNENPVKLEAPAMRNAHSTSQLNSGGKYVSNNNSMSDLSNASICSDSKKKKKWPFKVFKKVFSRSTTKLQESNANFY